MKNERGSSVIGPIVAIALLIGIIYLLVEYTNRPKPLIIDSASVQTFGEISNECGQTVVKIGATDLSSWVKQNQKAKIVSMAGVGDGTYGCITSYVIVYEKVE